MDSIFDKEKFISRVGKISAFREGEQALTASTRALLAEVEELQGQIRQIEDELRKMIFVHSSHAEKRRREIRERRQKIEEKEETIRQQKEELEALMLETFGSSTMPAVFLGRYPQDASGKVLPLEWDVISRQENHVLLTTRRVINQMRYAPELEQTPWKDSQIRSYLNGEFLENCFTAEERALILEQELENIGCETYHTPGSETTVDRVFLPSIEEIRQYSTYDPDRIAKPTAYAKGKGVFCDRTTGGAYWWLRSNGGNMINASIVNFKGYLFEYGFYVNSDRYGIRPCIWVEIES